MAQSKYLSYNTLKKEKQQRENSKFKLAFFVFGFVSFFFFLIRLARFKDCCSKRMLERERMWICFFFFFFFFGSLNFLTSLTRSYTARQASQMVFLSFGGVSCFVGEGSMFVHEIANNLSPRHVNERIGFFMFCFVLMWRNLIGCGGWEDDVGSTLKC